MGKEIERKYLLRGRPAGLGDGVDIRQGYLAAGDPEVRIRSAGGRYFLTRKGGEGFVREEEEIEISGEIFGILWPLTEGARIEKRRYALAGSENQVWEVDEFHGDLEGLWLAEIELPDESTQPHIPQEIAVQLVLDVTDHPGYKNKNLATKGRPVE